MAAYYKNSVPAQEHKKLLHLLDIAYYSGPVPLIGVGGIALFSVQATSYLQLQQ